MISSLSEVCIIRPPCLLVTRALTLVCLFFNKCSYNSSSSLKHKSNLNPLSLPVMHITQQWAGVVYRYFFVIPCDVYMTFLLCTCLCMIRCLDSRAKHLSVTCRRCVTNVALLHSMTLLPMKELCMNLFLCSRLLQENILALEKVWNLVGHLTLDSVYVGVFTKICICIWLNLLRLTSVL